jgi:hypothetical protein
MVHYYVHYNPPLDHTVSQLNPVHTLTRYSFKTNSNTPHLRLRVPSGLFPSGLQLNVCIILSNTNITIVRRNNNKEYICSQSYVVLKSRFASYAQRGYKQNHCIRTENGEDSQMFYIIRFFASSVASNGITTVNTNFYPRMSLNKLFPYRHLPLYCHN